jgi:hypothetical protein
MVLIRLTMPLPGPVAPQPRTEEFGLRAANTAGSGTHGQVVAAYAGTNYAWNPATTTAIANSNSLADDVDVFTVTYGANVNPTTPYGSYSSTFNYVCTPTF